MPILAQRAQVAIKTEAIAGTPETLSDGDVILTTELPSFEPDVQVTERQALTRSLDQRGHVVGARAAKLNFKQYLRGTESAPASPGNLPDFTLPFRAAGLLSSVVGPTTEYAFDSDEMSADPGSYFTVGLFHDGKLYSIHGAVADVTLIFEIGKPILAEYAFTGVYAEPTDTPLLNPTYIDVVEPPFLGATFSVLGFSAAKLRNMTLKIGNEITLRPDPNDVDASGYFTAQITGRKMTGSFDPEETFAADKNWWNEWTHGVSGVIDTGVFPNNGDPYNRFQMTLNNVQYHTVKTADRNGIITAPIDFAIKALTDPGDDSLLFVQS